MSHSLLCLHTHHDVLQKTRLHTFQGSLHLCLAFSETKMATIRKMAAHHAHTSSSQTCPLLGGLTALSSPALQGNSPPTPPTLNRRLPTPKPLAGLQLISKHFQPRHRFQTLFDWTAILYEPSTLRMGGSSGHPPITSRREGVQHPTESVQLRCADTFSQGPCW